MSFLGAQGAGNSSFLDVLVIQLGKLWLLVSAGAALYFLLKWAAREIVALFGDALGAGMQFQDKPPLAQPAPRKRRSRLSTSNIEGTPTADSPLLLDDEEGTENPLVSSLSASSSGEEQGEAVPATPPRPEEEEHHKRQIMEKAVMGVVLFIVAAYIGWGFFAGGAQHLSTFEKNSAVPKTAEDRLGHRSATGRCGYYFPYDYMTHTGVRVPVMTCACYDLITPVHESLFGSPLPRKSTALIDGSATPLVELGLTSEFGEEDEVVRMRRYVHDMCLFEEASFLALPRARETLIKLPVPWANGVAPMRVSGKNMTLENGQIRHFMLSGSFNGSDDTEDLVPYVNVQALLPHIGLSPAMVALEDVLESARQWYASMLAEARAEELVPDVPCLCAEHLGIINSGLFFLHEEGSLGTETEEGTWRLMLHPVITENVTRPGEVTSVQYKRRLVFPALLDAAYNATADVHHGRVRVTYLDLQELMASPKGREEVGRILPRWRHQQHLKQQMAQHLEEEGEGAGLRRTNVAHVSPFHACPLAKLDPRRSVAVKHAELTGLPNACLHHCMQLSAIARAHLFPEPNEQRDEETAAGASTLEQEL